MPEHVDKPTCTLGHVYYDLTLPRCPHRPHRPYRHSSSLSHYSGQYNSRPAVVPSIPWPIAAARWWWRGGNVDDDGMIIGTLDDEGGDDPYLQV